VSAEVLLLDYSSYVPVLGSFDTYARLFLENLYYFGVLFIIFVFYVAFLSRRRPLVVAHFLIVFAPFGVLPPIIDHFLFGRVANYTYGTIENLAENIRTFAFTSGDTGFGIALFAIGAVLSISLYIFRARQSFALSLASVPITSAIIMLFSTPDLLFGDGRGDYGYDYFLPLYYILPACIISIGLMYIYRRHTLFTTIRHLRIGRGLFFIGAVLLGYLAKDIGAASLVFSVPPTRLILAALAAFTLWIFSVVINDMNDIAIDRQTNRSRPLVTGAVTLETYRGFAWAFAFLGISLAALTNLQVFIASLSFLLLAYLYSSPPFRLRRHFLSANITISLALILSYIMGVFAMWDGGLSFLLLPDHLRVYVLTLLLGIIIFSAKDRKDQVGDGDQGITTLYTLYGDVGGTRIIMVLVSLLYNMIPILTGALWLFTITLPLTLVTLWLYQVRGNEVVVYLGSFAAFMLAYIDLFYLPL
jgi:4-hydroxybenzoate polyprenyltransferase